MVKRDFFENSWEGERAERAACAATVGCGSKFVRKESCHFQNFFKSLFFEWTPASRPVDDDAVTAFRGWGSGWGLGLA
jgi:hypothetical protein